MKAESPSSHRRNHEQDAKIFKISAKTQQKLFKIHSEIMEDNKAAIALNKLVGKKAIDTYQAQIDQINSHEKHQEIVRAHEITLIRRSHD